MLDEMKRQLQGIDSIKVVSKTKKRCFKLFFYLCILFGLPECKTPQQKAEQFPLTKEQACPNFGKLNRKDFESAIYQVSNYMNELRNMDGSLIRSASYQDSNMIQLESTIYIDGRPMQSVLEFWATNALNIKNKREFTEFEKIYKALCGKEIPFVEEIPYHKQVMAEKQEVEKRQQEEYDNLEAIAKSQKINLDEILDLRKETIRNEFLLAWYNSKENPDIENNIRYSENEFKYQEDKKDFEDYRKYKYAITDSFTVWGDYDLKKKAYSISQDSDIFITSRKVKGDFTGTVTRLLKMKTSLKEEDTIKSRLSVSISPDRAENFIKELKEVKNIIILSKFSPASLVTTGKCTYPDQYYEIRDDEYSECKERFENRKIKFKYLVGEPLKYRFVYDGEVYKNY